MIHIDRSRVPVPPEVRSWREAGVAELEEYFELPEAKRKQRRPPFVDPKKYGLDLETALMELFRSKCGYCEISLEGSKPIVDRFRPRARAQDKGKIFPEHYSWLAYDWDNFVLSCKLCHRYKGRAFPIVGARAKPWTVGSGLDREKALLVDSGRPDTDSHFLFELDGTVRGITREGKETVELMQLNRSQLVTARNRAAAEVDAAFRNLPLGTEKQRRKALAVARALAAEDLPYSAARMEQFNLLALEVAEWSVSPKSVTPQAKELPPLWAEDYGAAVWLRRVEIENFRALHELSLDFPEPEEDADGVLQEPWIMLLGENGVGKSSILKAIALAMASPKERRRLAPNAGSFFNRRVKKGSGAIRLFFSGSDEPLELRFNKRSEVFEATGVMPRLPVRAYGSTRLLPVQSRRGQRSPARRAQIENLFDPRTPLADAQVWLGDTKQVPSTRFNLLATSLKTLLCLGEEDLITRRVGELSATLGEARVTMRELSDGYQSLFALTTDLMLHLSKASFDMESVAGLVLLDEIEVHLHPQWKIEVVGRLRRLFPNVRFLATTHDPLCLHGLKDGEVHVLGRDSESHRVDIEQVNVPPGLRADQLLTGFWFGLASTRDDGTLDMMRRHGELILLRSPSSAEQKERQEIEQELDQRLHGFDRLELEAETKKRAKTAVRRTRTNAEKQALRKKILGRLSSTEGAGS